MLESTDILYIVLAFCVLWFTAFLCWLMYQAVSIVRHAHDVLEMVERKIDLLERSVTGIKAKFDSGTAIFVTLADGLRRVVDLVRKDRREE